MNRRTDRRKLGAWLLVLALILVAQATPASAAQKPRGVVRSAGKAAVTQYLVIAPHNPDQCLASLDAVEAMPNGAQELAQWDWGCMSGDHTGYLIVAAASPDDALQHVPRAERATARVVKLNKFTPAEIKSFHEKK
jgi:hypothetical protein